MQRHIAEGHLSHNDAQASNLTNTVLLHLPFIFKSNVFGAMYSSWDESELLYYVNLHWTNICNGLVILGIKTRTDPVKT